MKKYKTYSILGILGATLVICAFITIPTIHFQAPTGESDDIDLSYRGADLQGNLLNLTVSYSGEDCNFEIGRDIVISTNSDLSSPLRIDSCREVDGNLVYEFKVDATARNAIAENSTLYIEPPILYIPTEIRPVTVALSEGETAPLAAEARQNAAKDWFSIDHVTVNEASAGIYCVDIGITAQAEDLPRLPKLVINEERYGGVSSIDFDDNGNFASGQLLFEVSAASAAQWEDLLKDAYLEIEDALIRADAADLLFSPSLTTLSVVVDGEA